MRIKALKAPKGQQLSPKRKKRRQEVFAIVEVSLEGAQNAELPKASTTKVEVRESFGDTTSSSLRGVAKLL